MLTVGRLIELALGPEEAKRVDTAIPQFVFDGMTERARQNIAGWYYAPEVRIFGRLLTKDECRDQILKQLKDGKIHASMLGLDVSYVASNWSCLMDHVERGEIQLWRVNEQGLTS